MIKFVAAILMLIDHVGAVLFPDVEIFRIVGRLSMPLFAFALARAFRNAGNGSVMDYKPYLCRLLIFAAVSQVPYSFAFSGLNIGFTWLLSFALLCVISHYGKLDKRVSWALIIIVFAAAVFLPVGFGLSGVVYPVLFYLCYYKYFKPNYAITGAAALFVVSVTIDRAGLIQGFAILAVPLVAFLAERDNINILPRWFYYAFYPAHIAILLFIIISLSY
jgi:hypothetical protein